MEFIALALLIVVVIFIALGIKIVPQSENYLIERLGRYNRTLSAGLHFITPVFERVAFKESILERQLAPDSIQTITLDNVSIYISRFQVRSATRLNESKKTWWGVLYPNRFLGR